MAEVRGRKCDRPDCKTFLADCGPNPPAGWARIHIVTDTGSGKDDQGLVEFCSNYCSAYWFLERYETETGKRLVRQPKNPKQPKREREA